MSGFLRAGRGLVPLPPLSEQRKLVTEWESQDQALALLQRRLLDWQAHCETLRARPPERE